MPQKDDNQQQQQKKNNALKRLQRELAEELLIPSSDNIVGVSVRSRSEPIIYVYVEEARPNTLASIPVKKDGIPVVIREVGKIQFLPATTTITTTTTTLPPPPPPPTTTTTIPTTVDLRNPLSLFTSMMATLTTSTPITRQRVRPIVAGLSISLSSIQATGTLGAIFRKAGGGGGGGGGEGEYILITNGHVLPPPSSNGGSEQRYIIQPGAVDGGNVSTDVIATLDASNGFIASTTTGGGGGGTATEKVYSADVAVATIITNSSSSNSSSSSNGTNGTILFPDQPNQLALPIDGSTIYSAQYYYPDLRVNDILHKVGRTTGYTYGRVIDTTATIKVSSSGGGGGGGGESVDLIFEDVVLTESMASAGDSGSMGFVLINGTPLPAALLFAGSDKVTAFCKFSNVIKELKNMNGAPLPDIQPLSIQTTEGGGTTTIDLNTILNTPVPATLMLAGIFGLSIFSSSLAAATKQPRQQQASSSSSSSSSLSSPSSFIHTHNRHHNNNRTNTTVAVTKNKEKNNNNNNNQKKRACSLCQALKDLKKELEMEGASSSSSSSFSSS